MKNLELELMMITVKMGPVLDGERSGYNQKQVLRTPVVKPRKRINKPNRQNNNKREIQECNFTLQIR